MPQGELLAPSAVPGQLELKLLLSSSEKRNISHGFRDLESVNQIKGLNGAQTNLWLKRQAGKHQWCFSLAMDTLISAQHRSCEEITPGLVKILALAKIIKLRK